MNLGAPKLVFVLIEEHADLHYPLLPSIDDGDTPDR